MDEKLNTLDMEIALMNHVGIRQNIVVPNVSWSFLSYEADLVILTKSNYATEIEIKISKSDLKKDKEKNHNHNNEHFKYLYFAVPKDLVEFALTEIPDRAGLYEVYKTSNENRYWVTQIRPPKLNKNHVRWKESERNYLSELGCMRILNLKEKIRKYKEISNGNRKYN